MEIRSGYLQETEYQESQKDFQTQKFRSALCCFNDHKGFRCGELHTFIAPKGGGKSTLSRTIISELIYGGQKILLYLSEEKAEKYLLELNEKLRVMYKNDQDKIERVLDKLTVVSELSIENEIDCTDWLKRIEYIIEEKEIDLFVFDNFTTSFLGELFVNKQSQLLRDLKKMAEAQDIPVLVFFHTAKGSSNKLFNGDDVRGSATAVNIGSYNYVLFYFRNINECFLMNEKARYHRYANGKIYRLKFSGKAGIFVDAIRSNIEELKTAAKANGSERK